MPTCANINLGMQQLPVIYYATNEKHKDVSQSRTRDIKDAFELLEEWKQWSPFDSDST